MKMMREGVLDALRGDLALQKGVNTLQGKITYDAVANAHGLEPNGLESML